MPCLRTPRVTLAVALLALPAAADDTQHRIGISFAGGYQLPITAEARGTRIPIERAPSLSFALSTRSPLRPGVAMTLGIGATHRSWRGEGGGEQVDGSILLFTAQGALRAAIGARVYLGAGGVIGRSNYVPVFVPVATGDALGSVEVPRKYTAVGPVGEVGTSLVDGVLDVGARVTWLVGAPGSPVMPQIYAGGWF